MNPAIIPSVAPSGLRAATFVALGLLASFFTTGCVTGRRVVDLPMPDIAPGATATKGTLAVAAVTDARRFENKPGNPSTPSIDGDVNTLTAEQKATFIARQRGGFGNAAGDVTLPPGDTVPKRMQALVEQGLKDRGYVISAPGTADAGTVKVVVNECWAWFTPGMWAITFEARIRLEIEIAQGGKTQTVVVNGYGKNSAQVASNENWKLAYHRAFVDFLANLDSELDKAGL